MKTNHDIEKRRFLKFSLVGFSGTVVDFGIFNLLTRFGMDPILSSVFSFITAVINNFYWNRNWTYPESKKSDIKIQLFQFSSVSLIGLMIRTPLFAFIQKPIAALISDWRLIQDFTSIEIASYNISLASVIVIILFWNFFANRLWTYRGI